MGISVETVIISLLIILTLYSYLIYPLILACLRIFNETLDLKTFDGASEENLPSVSMIITVYNEELRISEKLENTRKLKYPQNKLEVIIASDSSTDNTEEIVTSFPDDRIRLVRATERLGKENAQKCAIEASGNEILVFSDVATELKDDAILTLVKYYQDATIGAVSSEDKFISQTGDVVGEGIYVRYEMLLRQLESSLAGLIGLSGSFFSCRKSVTQQWDIHSPSDFNTALNCAKLGLKAVSAPDVHGYYKDLKDPKKEYQRKVRTVLRGMNGLKRHASVLNPFKYGLFAFQLLSHKVMRWLVPVFMMLVFICNLLFLGSGFTFKMLMLLQVLFYLSCVAAHFNMTIRNISLVKIMYFFVQVNIAISHSLLLFLSGKKMTVWNPSQR